MRRELLALLAVLAWVGCKSGNEGEARPVPSGPAVATMDHDAITREEFEKHLKEQSPFIRSRYTTLDKKKEFLDGMIRFELLADAARKEGYDKDPDVQSTLEKIMVQKLIHKKFGDEGSEALPEADLRAYYEQHKDEYVKPERLRLQIVVFKGDGAEVRGKQALAELAPKKGDLAAFGMYASTHSEDPATKGRNGDTDYHTDDELASAYGPGVAQAAEKLQQINELSPLVHGKDGWYLLKLIGRQAALDRTFEQVKPALQSRLWHDRQNKAFEDYVKQLRDQAHVVVNDAELDKVDVGAPNLDGNGPRYAPPGGAVPSSPPMAGKPFAPALRRPPLGLRPPPPPRPK